MATYTTLRRGSKGDEVKKLQNSLINAGYDVGSSGADGIYGNNTAAAVKAYQKANGLSVDGIAGNQTLGKLYGGSTATTTTTPSAAQDTSFKYEDFKPDPFTKSDDLTNLGTQHIDKINNPYVVQESPYLQYVNDTLNKLMNREEFSYDLNGDALYQQYKDQYTTQGQMAMMDTMGQAAAMTGGYGNSYAQGVGQQAYQGYLQQLNDKVPELYQIALSQYNQEGQDLKDMLSVYNSLDQQHYAKERDKVSDHYTEIGLLGDQYDRMYNEEYGTWSDMTSIAKDNHTNRQNYEYQSSQDAITNATNLAMTMVGSGIMPTADVLTAAGISPVDASAIMNKVKENEKKAANSSTTTSIIKPTSDQEKAFWNYYDMGDFKAAAAYVKYLRGLGVDERILGPLVSNIPDEFLF